MATNNKPANQLRCGNIKATIWENVSEKGPFFSTTLFGLNDLEAMLTVAREAKEWIATHAVKR